MLVCRTLQNVHHCLTLLSVLAMLPIIRAEWRSVHEPCWQSDVCSSSGDGWLNFGGSLSLLWPLPWDNNNRSQQISTDSNLSVSALASSVNVLSKTSPRLAHTRRLQQGQSCWLTTQANSQCLSVMFAELSSKERLPLHAAKSCFACVNHRSRGP